MKKNNYDLFIFIRYKMAKIKYLILILLILLPTSAFAAVYTDSNGYIYTDSNGYAYDDGQSDGGRTTTVASIGGWSSWSWSSWSWGGGSSAGCTLDTDVVFYDDNCQWELIP